MKERIHNYGKQRNLQGIATIPDKIQKKLPAIILLNAGVVHKVGPFNLNIFFARHFTPEGYLVFRFDLSGLGDSFKINNNAMINDTVMSDFKQTMSLIEEQYGINKFIVIGLCTGADFSHKIATEDQRVVGNVWLDGYGYPTRKYLYLRYAPILLSPKRLLNVFLNKLNGKKQTENMKGVDSYIWKLPEKNNYLKDMENLYKRNVKCLYLFSGGVKRYYNYENQFYESFKGAQFLDNVHVEYYPRFDHIYVIHKDREYIASRICDWLNDNFSCCISQNIIEQTNPVSST